MSNYQITRNYVENTEIRNIFSIATRKHREYKRILAVRDINQYFFCKIQNSLIWFSVKILIQLESIL